jgi:hypothetical protein
VLKELPNLESFVISTGANFGTILLYFKFEPYREYVQRCDSYLNLVITL